MNDMEFPADFIFGAAAAAFQIEGSCDVDGKGQSIWDEFSHRKGKIRNADNADKACDHFNRTAGDIKLMKDLNLDAYRFSISWPRIYPDGKGMVNQKGLDFYSRLADSLLENKIEPFATLFHWDLPLELQKKYKGFQSRNTSDYFADYTETVAKHLGDRVKNWITINEPFVFAACGHLLGIHAPGIKSISAHFKVIHNLLLAHGKALQVIKNIVPDSKAGITLSLSPVHPATQSDRDKWSAMIGNQFLNHIALSPLYKGEYPEPLWNKMKLFTPEIKDGDMEIISHPSDFLGINVYTREHAVHKWNVPFLKSGLVKKKIPESEYEKNGKEYTSMGWEIYPDAIYELLKMVQNEYGNPPVFITENGAAFNDTVADGKIADEKRINFLKGYLRKVHQARIEGVNVRGYFCWSLMDNFEWAEGFAKRFGLIYVDYDTQKRIIKDSGYWYRDFIRMQKDVT